MRKDMKAALSKSVKAETAATKDRFSNADKVMSGATKPHTGVPHKAKVIRDAFSMPEDDHALFEQLITRAATKGALTNKSELVRAGLHALNNMPDNQFLKALQAIEKIKTGRPAQ